jgi:hypothetical protein
MPETGREVRTLRDAFCRRFRCRPDAFERRLLARCLPPMQRLPATIWLTLRPSSFARELTLLSRLGSATDASLLRPELDGYAYENERDKPIRVVVFGLRLSRRRFRRIFREVMEKPTTP